MAQMQMVQDEFGETAKRSFELFLEEFSSSDDVDQVNSTTGRRVHDYVEQAAMMAQNDHTTIYVDFMHVLSYETNLADSVMLNFYQLQPFLRKAAHNFVQAHHPDFVKDNMGNKEV